MIYVGIDLHRKRSQIAALDEQGRSCSRAEPRTTQRRSRWSGRWRRRAPR
jgi:hypothetical protein